MSTNKKTSWPFIKPDKPKPPVFWRWREMVVCFTTHPFPSILFPEVKMFDHPIWSKHLPSREFTYPTKREKETHRLKTALERDMLVPRRVDLSASRMVHLNKNPCVNRWAELEKAQLKSSRNTFHPWVVFRHPFEPFMWVNIPVQWILWDGKMVGNHHFYILGGGLNLKNMRKSNWIMKPQTFGVKRRKCLSCHHLAEKYIHENYPPEKDHISYQTRSSENHRLKRGWLVRGVFDSFPYNIISPY